MGLRVIYRLTVDLGYVVTHFVLDISDMHLIRLPLFSR